MEKKKSFSLIIHSDSPPPSQQYFAFLALLWFFLVLLIFLAAPEDYLKLGLPLLAVAAGATAYFTVYFYSRYELRVNSRSIEWKSEALPERVVQAWREDVSSYREIALVKIKPFESERNKIAFSPGLIGYPMRQPTGRGIKNPFNSMECVVVLLRHKTNSKRNASLKYFPLQEEGDWKEFVNSIAQSLDLPVNDLVQS